MRVLGGRVRRDVGGIKAHRGVLGRRGGGVARREHGRPGAAGGGACGACSDALPVAAAPGRCDARRPERAAADVARVRCFPRVREPDVDRGAGWVPPRRSELVVRRIQPGSTIVIVRQWMRDFIDTCLPNLLDKSAVGYIVIGTPGIGKSVSINYFLWRYLNLPNGDSRKRWRYVIALLPKEGEYCVFDTEKQVTVKLRLDSAPINGFIDRLGENNVLVLHDIGHQPGPVTTHKVPTILFTSPKREKYKDYFKNGRVCIFYAPPPNPTEMSFMATNVFRITFEDVWRGLRDPPVKDWQGAAYYFGSVPPLVFSRAQPQ